MHLTVDNHYIISLDFKFYQLYIVWIGDETDCVLVDDNCKIIAFKTEAALLRYWHLHIKESITEVTIYHVNKAQQWIGNPDTEFDCNEFLNLWNLFTDISTSTKIPFTGDVKDDIRNTVYDKLFNASDGYWADELNPIFNAPELDMLKMVMQNGIEILLNNISVIENEIILP
ncbi:hypothetical protein [Mucilaginibacter flavus]|uniref:hypothetical protein n=1 Tax=Mucilaginibacter flavus TaxID=931504 RepID=UPI0025B3F339|nr:hypothetical protein [Mucilaginibacter flavus]MDN3582909.1 hypothetical protein [Mucilaginibacter flavus]